ncbi:MAG TPA: hypothetical protein VHE30_16310 [Polyangiaceae bacterium]|nr:hypothetical protein [Polyangiaceae bacterium]
MSVSVVVCYRFPEREVEASHHLGVLRALADRATARGGRLLSFGATVMAFEHDEDSAEDVVELALTVVREAEGGDEPAVAVSEGELARIEGDGPLAGLAWGPPLVRATALARVAHPGEVVVDPSFSPAKRGDLHTPASRVGVHGKERIRGLVVDPKHPFRTALGTGSAKAIGRPVFVGRPELASFAVEGNALSVVRASRGHGGSRFLEELEQRLEPARVLQISPHPFGEPLGALRRALLRAVTLGQAPQNLAGQAGEGLDALLAGEGLDPDSSVELLATWLTPDSVNDPRGVAILDDASEIDLDTLEVVGRAAHSASEPFAVVIRIGADAPVPAPLAELSRRAEVSLAPLSASDAAHLASACTHGDLNVETCARWAKRGASLPLGVVESIRESMDAGEIAWEDGEAVVRPRPGADDSHTPKHWVKRRLTRQEGDARRVLEALAILGGHAEARDLHGVLRKKLGSSFEANAPLAFLEAGGWIARRKPDVVALPTATHRDAVLSALSDGDFQAFHGAACEWFAERDRPLASAAATVHAILSSDSTRAAELARRAAAATRAMGLEVTAHAFDGFAERGDVSALASRYLFTSQLEMARAAPSVWPEARKSLPPTASVVVPSGASAGIPGGRRSLPPPKPAWARKSKPEDGSAPPASPSLAPKATEPPSKAVEALRKGDVEAVERMAARVSVEESKSGLAERLSAMAKLARGETGDAIRRLRDAAEEARRKGSRDRCRASLALAVALGSAGRHDEALLEALDGLARARESSDARGERACVRFLSQLAATAGHHDVAEAWASSAAAEH